MNAETAELIVDFISGLLPRRRHPVRRLVLLMLAGLFGLIGLIFLVIAADLALAEQFSPPVAAGLVGLGLAILAAILAGAALWVRHMPPRRAASEMPLAALIELGSSMAGEVEGAIRSAPGTATAAAFAAGCIVGCHPELTRGLHRGLGDLIR